jgi:gamma-glutamylcyclotransferase (GGCT)/AIG2-like uncharacterized protein YtfP
VTAPAVAKTDCLFVYGSLKRGHVNHPEMLRSGGRFLGPAQTLKPYLLDLSFAWPRLQRGPGPGARVGGELFRVRSPEDGSGSTYLRDTQICTAAS